MARRATGAVVSTEAPASYLEERRRLTLVRVRWATSLALVPIGVSAAANPLAFADRLAEHLATHAVQAALCVAVFLAAYARAAERLGVALAVLLTVGLGTTLFWSFSLCVSDLDVLVGPLAGILIGSTLVFPWGVGAQAFVSAYIAGGYLLLVPWGTLDPARAGNVAIGLALGVLLSVFGAWILDRQRRATFAERERVSALARQSELLADVGRQLNATLELDQLVERVTDQGRRLVGGDGAVLTLLDEARGVLRAAALSPPSLARDHEPRSLEFAAADIAPVIDEIARHGVVQLPGGTALDALHQLHSHHGWRRTLHAAIQRDGRLLGVLTFLQRAPEPPFSEHHVRLAEGVASQAAIALANARLVTDLQSANRAKSEFVSTMSHELRTPLHVIMGYTDLLEDLPAEDRRRALDRIRSASRELLDLIEATLDLGRMEAHHDQPVLEPLRVADLWGELAAEFSALPRDPALALRWEPTDGVELHTDRRKLKIILKNLVGNALKFTPVGSIVVSCRPNGTRCAFSVCDTGVGIDRAHLPVIFEMFRQVDSSDSRSYGGAGLGLYIVRRLVEQLGGDIGVTSMVGHGSTFTVTLPLRAARSPSAA